METQSAPDCPQSGDYYMSLDCCRLKVKEYNCGTIEVFDISSIPLLEGNDSAAKYTGPAILKVYSTTETPEADGIATKDEQNSRALLVAKAEREVDALSALNKKGCEYVPKLLAHWIESTGDIESEDSSTDGSPCNAATDSSLKHYILMTKVPGITLESKFDWLPRDEKVQKTDAFRIAIASVQECGVDNGSAHLGNVIWSEQENKCYIIDFERATYKRHKFGSTYPDDWGMLW
ncbi:hypothetical protein LTR86_008432 [Recurvomyces mirabilis]|nr:hypothetical protein LTR86_008432 [Recurvomyces mirabilis]